MAGAGIITLVVMLLLLPFALLRDLWRFRQRWRLLPLQQRNTLRATAGACALVACAVLAAHDFPLVGWKLTAASAAVAAFYLGVGIHGARGAAFDVMAAVWWAVIACGGAALLVVAATGWPL